MTRIRNSLPVVMLLALPAVGLGPRLVADDGDTEDLYRKVVDSAVFIVTPMKGGHAEGSGSLIDKEKRLVITNYHVVADAEKIYVQFPVHDKDGNIMTDKKKYIGRIPDGLASKGTVLYRDKTRDLAIVQLDKVPATARPIVLARHSARAGTTTFNIGNPGVVHQVFSMTQGTVRAVGDEDFPVRGEGEILRIKAKMVTATNPTNPGDSGGPLFNKHGEQVAVTESGLSGAAAQQVNSFVDVTEVRAFLAEKKITFKELSTEPEDKKITPKFGPGSAKSQPKLTTPPVTPTPPPVINVTPGKTVEVPVPPGAIVPSDADEQAAAKLLQRAKLFEEGDDNRPTYITKLKDVVTKYPTTAAAKEAKKKLDALK